MDATLNILDSLGADRPAVMGILNVTPDSFSDGGRFFSPKPAIAHAREMIRQGADILDVGAESTRPGSRRIPAEEQIARLGAVLPAVTAMGAAVSVDTTLSAVAEFALDAGAVIVNDISAGRDDPKLLRLVAQRGAWVVLMHMLGEPATMQHAPHYNDVVAEVQDFLQARAAEATRAGVDPRRIILDPGIGFGKRLEHNLALIAATPRLAGHGLPLLVGASRKSLIQRLAGETPPPARLPGSLALHLRAAELGAALLRVHDVAEHAQALAALRAVAGAEAAAPDAPQPAGEERGRG